MGEYEPNDSRNVTQTKSNVPGEPERTGPHEGETRDPRKDADEGQIQRSRHTPGGKDLSRGSEPATGAASRHRR
ncbi:hypothetical protein NCF85_10400 [Qipengyuania citrea]|uniref:Uncharacterized protein n=1 Tax=Qipengyuania citrea TaxID=225971 RepID=A0ABY4U563_9SPHN|nr:hypothetical protein [Qipengyuania citrea]USA60514.1 hypothetical protein NCF85_10400 [Qipengyuania citrea]